jgi:hypothetical protein
MACRPASGSRCGRQFGCGAACPSPPPPGITCLHLQEVPDEEWKDGRGVRWDHADVARLLDVAQASLQETSARLKLDVLLVRKDRAIGIIPNPSRAAAGRAGAAGYGAGAHIPYEALEEVALAVQVRQRPPACPLPLPLPSAPLTLHPSAPSMAARRR